MSAGYIMRVNARLLFATFGVAALVSCGDSTAPTPVPDLDEALDALSGAQGLAAPGIAMMGGMVAPRSSGPTTCAFNASNSRFECQPVSSGGMTMTRYYQLLDANGAPQPAWNTNVVAIKNVMDRSGTMSMAAPITVQMTGHDESTLSGLRSEIRTLTGTGTSSFTTTSATGTSTSNMTQTTNLTLPTPGPDAYPTGTITMTMTTAGSSSPGVTMTMTYDGTSKVTMTTNIGGLTQTCTLDMNTPQTAPVCTR